MREFRRAAGCAFGACSCLCPNDPAIRLDFCSFCSCPWHRLVPDPRPIKPVVTCARAIAITPSPLARRANAALPLYLWLFMGSEFMEIVFGPVAW